MTLIVSPDFPWGSGPWCLPCSSCEQLGVACSVCYWISPLVSGLKVRKDFLRTEAGVELNSQMCQVGMATWYLVSCAQMLIDCTCVCVKSSFVIVCQKKTGVTPVRRAFWSNMSGSVELPVDLPFTMLPRVWRAVVEVYGYSCHKITWSVSLDTARLVSGNILYTPPPLFGIV